MKHVFIGSTVRSGGSLVARLFDHHPDCASYPFELHLPMDGALHPTLARRGEKVHVQDWPRVDAAMSSGACLSAALVDEDAAKCLFGGHFLGGRMQAKSRHMQVAARFDHARFLSRAREGLGGERSLRALYDAIHRAFFATWDDGAHGGTMRFVVYHRANGLLADIGRFFESFSGGGGADDGAFLVLPVRSPSACLASEKRKVLSQVVSGTLDGGFRPSDRWLKYTYGRFVEATLVNWLVTFTRAVVLKEHFGERVLLLRYEDLVRAPEAMMRALAAAAGVPWHESLLRPTNAGHDWAGNSMFGSTEGIDAARAATAEERDLLNKTERRLLDQYAGGIVAWLDASSRDGGGGGFLDVATLDRSALFDHDQQVRFFGDRDKTALYFASLYERWRYRSIGASVRAGLRKKPAPYFL